MGDWVTNEYQIIAHKGNSSGCPENTNAAIASAIENQCTMVEIDVSVTSDGYSVALHGPSLESTTSGSGKVNQTVLEELLNYFVRGQDGEITDIKVSLVEDLLRNFGSKTKWNLDLKEGRIEDDLSQVIYNLGLQNHIVLSGLKFSDAKRTAIRNSDLNLLVNLSKVDQLFVALKFIGPLYARYRFRSLSQESSVIAINMHYRYVSKQMIREIHKLGLEVWVYTVDDADLFTALFANGVDSITTNLPLEMRDSFHF
tara:strand:- start:765 stop:1532 length:768 start_codon:yes stop_codon:yes gene_type:complete